MIAAVRGLYKPRRIKYFQVRTRTTMNMTAGARETMALMGGVGALYSSLVRNKSAEIYAQCVAACPVNMTLRAFVTRRLRAGLAAKNATIIIAAGVNIVNPWVSSAAPNVPVSNEILDKFSSVLSSNS